MRSARTGAFALLLLGAASTTSGAQAMRSQPQAITLIAVKLPTVQALDAVHVSVAPSIPSPSGSELQTATTVTIRDDGLCEIRATGSGATEARVSVAVENGAEFELRRGAPIKVFSGECHSASPVHGLTFHVEGSSAPGNLAQALDVALEVVCLHDGQFRHWRVDLPVGSDRAIP